MSAVDEVFIKEFHNVNVKHAHRRCLELARRRESSFTATDFKSSSEGTVELAAGGSS